MDIEVCVTKGVELLDAEGPMGWREMINLNTLDMGDGHLCILGQIYSAAALSDSHASPYGLAIERLRLDYWAAARGHGFTAEPGDVEELGAAWRRAIASD